MRAISSTDVPSNPFSANSVRPTSISCSRRSRCRSSAPREVVARPGAPARGSAIVGSRRVTGSGGAVAQAPVTVGRAAATARAARASASARRRPSRPSRTSRIRRALRSICPCSTPWRAQVGSAWCRLCHDSPKRQDRQPPDVARLVAATRTACSPIDVADRVDRPGHVVQQADADEAGPEERGHRALPRPGEQAAERRPGSSSEVDDQRGEQPGHADDVAVLEQVGRVLLPRLVCSTSNSQPMCA